MLVWGMFFHTKYNIVLHTVSVSTRNKGGGVHIYIQKKEKRIYFGSKFPRNANTTHGEKHLK